MALYGWNDPTQYSGTGRYQIRTSTIVSDTWYKVVNQLRSNYQFDAHLWGRKDRERGKHSVRIFLNVVSD